MVYHQKYHTARTRLGEVGEFQQHMCEDIVTLRAIVLGSDATLAVFRFSSKQRVPDIGNYLFAKDGHE
eukprot:1359462-Prorocentrum_lima.AAC.1